MILSDLQWLSKTCNDKQSCAPPCDSWASCSRSYARKRNGFIQFIVNYLRNLKLSLCFRLWVEFHGEIFCRAVCFFHFLTVRVWCTTCRERLNLRSQTAKYPVTCLVRLHSLRCFLYRIGSRSHNGQLYSLVSTVSFKFNHNHNHNESAYIKTWPTVNSEI